MSAEVQCESLIKFQQIDCTNPDFFGFQRAVDVRLWKRGVGYTLGLPRATPTLPLLSMGGGEGWKFQTMGMSCIAAPILVSSVQWNGSIKGEIGGGRCCRQTDIAAERFLTADRPKRDPRKGVSWGISGPCKKCISKRGECGTTFQFQACNADLQGFQHLTSIGKAENGSSPNCVLLISTEHNIFFVGLIDWGWHISS